MNKLTAGIIIGTAGLAASAYVPVKVGDTVQQQIEQAVSKANAKEQQYGIRIDILEYEKNPFSSDVVTRFTVTDPAIAGSAENPLFLDLKHRIRHGFGKAEFESEVVVTEQMQADLTETDNKVPLHFDGFITTDHAEVNTYIEGFTLSPEGGTIRVNPGIIRLNYDQEAFSYDINGIWNGIRMETDDTTMALGETSLKGSGEQFSNYIWSYNNTLNISSLNLNDDRISLRSNAINLHDKFDIQMNPGKPDSIHYSGDWSLDKLHIQQYGQTLYEFEPSGFSYALTGPTVEQTEQLLKAAQAIQPDQMTPEQAERILPLFADAVNAARFSLHDINVVTTEGRINADMSLQLKTSQQELIRALNFPASLVNYLQLESEANISKSLFNSMPVLAVMAMQLNQVGAYKDDEDDMLIKAQMQQGQLMINGVSLR